MVASAVGELPHSVRDGLTGLVVPPGDTTALGQALSFLISRPEALEGMGRAARARTLRQFSPAAFAQAGAAVMERLATRVAKP